jgi:hypothetical protein
MTLLYQEAKHLFFTFIILLCFTCQCQLVKGMAHQEEKDDTDSLQSLINSAPKVIRLNRTYVINKTLSVPAGVDIIGGTIKNGSNMSGTLLTNNVFLKYDHADKNRLINVRFESKGNFQLSNWASAVVVLKNCRNITIKQCTFNLNQAYNPKGAEAIWITGERSSGNQFLFNNLLTAGIEYAENGACNSLVKGNLIINAHSDAISGHGNGKTPCTGHVITQNTIRNAGFMGIEDWGNCDGTVISDNRVFGTGKSYEQQKEGIGISAVGTNTKVIHNLIRDARLYYIESGGNHHILVARNQIIDTEFKAIGIISNFTKPGPYHDTGKNSSIIRNNSIQGTKESIQVFGNFVTCLLIDSNVITNPQYRGIDIDSDAGNYQVSLIANKLVFDVQAKQGRIAILSYTRKSDLTGQRLVIKNNILTYHAGSENRRESESGFVIGTNNSVISGNKVISKDHSVHFLSTVHNAVSGLNMTGNLLNGSSYKN